MRWPASVRLFAKATRRSRVHAHAPERHAFARGTVWSIWKSWATVVVTPDHGSVHRPVFTVHALDLVKVTGDLEVRMSSTARVSLQPSTSIHPPKAAVRLYESRCEGVPIVSERSDDDADVVGVVGRVTTVVVARVVGGTATLVVVASVVTVLVGRALLADPVPYSASEIAAATRAPSRMTKRAIPSCHGSDQSRESRQNRLMPLVILLTSSRYGAPASDSHGIPSLSASSPATSP